MSSEVVLIMEVDHVNVSVHATAVRAYHKEADFLRDVFM